MEAVGSVELLDAAAARRRLPHEAKGQVVAESPARGVMESKVERRRGVRAPLLLADAGVARQAGCGGRWGRGRLCR